MSKPITDVGIDLDGVIYPFSTAFRAYCQERMGQDNLPDPTHWNFFIDWGLKEETFQTWLREAATSHRVFATEMPYPSVIEAWELLRKNNIRIHVMTARPQEAWGQTAEWLDKYGLVCDSLHFNPTKTFLSHFASGRAAMLDDHIHYYEEARKAGIAPFLLNQPWNQELANANRVNTVLEFAYAVIGHNKIVDLDNFPKKETATTKTTKFDLPEQPTMSPKSPHLLTTPKEKYLHQWKMYQNKPRNNQSWNEDNYYWKPKD